MRADFEHHGRRVSYLDVRPPAPREAGVVLFLHAFPLAAAMWEPQLASVPAGWRFVAVDFRGFGESGPEREGAGGYAASPSIDDYARDAIALLDHIGSRSAIVCGLSMGGYTAFALWRLARERVRGLVLADTRPDADSPEARAGRDRMIEMAAREGARAVAEAMLPRLLGPTSRESRPAVVGGVRALASAQPAAAIADALARLKARPDSTPQLAEMDCPTLLVAGEEDEVTPPDIARQMHGQIAGADLALIGRAGHLSNIEQPDEFNEALARFLAERFIQP